MSHSTAYVLSGPEDDYGIPKECFGKIIFECLKKRNPNEVLNVDAITKDTLTCGELLELSIKSTAVLRNLGIGKGDVIAIISESSINYFIPVLAAFYMGVTVNPLNPDYSIGELKHCLIISQAKLILCSETSLENVLKVKEELKFVKQILLTGRKSETCKSNIKSFENVLETTFIDTDTFKPNEFDYAEQVAFIVSSSGTTGLPKGVMITHQNLRIPIGLFSHPRYVNTSSEDITVVVVPFFHVYGILLQMLTMVTSMKSILMTKFRPDIFLTSIQKFKVTKLFLVPPLLLFLTKSPLIKNFDISSVRDILVGAAPLGKDLQVEATKRLRTVIIRQIYGLSETCGPCTLQIKDNKAGSVGVLAPTAIVKVVNPDSNKTVGPLETGEICFKGPMIMKGYIPAQEHLDKDGFFHSGDVGYYDHEGYFYMVDRIKELIKYKGFLVAPAELEALIITHPMVGDCGVIGIPDERAGEVPVAFVVLKKEASIAEQEIVDFVAERISVQKRLYGGVRFVDAIPKNPSGKIERRKLRETFNNNNNKY